MLTKEQWLQAKSISRRAYRQNLDVTFSLLWHDTIRYDNDLHWKTGRQAASLIYRDTMTWKVTVQIRMRRRIDFVHKPHNSTYLTWTTNDFSDESVHLIELSKQDNERPVGSAKRSGAALLASAAPTDNASSDAFTALKTYLVATDSQHFGWFEPTIRQQKKNPTKFAIFYLPPTFFRMHPAQGRRSLWDRGDTSPQYLDRGGTWSRMSPPQYFWSNISYFLSMQCFLDKLKEFLVF